MASEYRTDPQMRAGATAAERTVIGQGVKINGDISSGGMVQVDGFVDGAIQASGVVVGAQGSVNGSVQADDLTVSGALEGEVEAQSAKLSATARVNANLTIRGTLAVEEGAQLEGDVRCTADGKARPSVGTGSAYAAASAGGSSSETATASGPESGPSSDKATGPDKSGSSDKSAAAEKTKH